MHPCANGEAPNPTIPKPFLTLPNSPRRKTLLLTTRLNQLRYGARGPPGSSCLCKPLRSFRPATTLLCTDFAPCRPRVSAVMALSKGISSRHTFSSQNTGQKMPRSPKWTHKETASHSVPQAPFFPAQEEKIPQKRGKRLLASRHRVESHDEA